MSDKAMEKDLSQLKNALDRDSKEVEMLIATKVAFELGTPAIWSPRRWRSYGLTSLFNSFHEDAKLTGPFFADNELMGQNNAFAITTINSTSVQYLQLSTKLLDGTPIIMIQIALQCAIDVDINLIMAYECNLQLSALLNPETVLQKLSWIAHSECRASVVEIVEPTNETAEILEIENGYLSARLEETTRENIKLLDCLQQATLKMEAMIDLNGEENANLKMANSRLVEERDKYAREAKGLTQQMEDTVEEVKKKEQLIYDLKKALAEGDTKYQMQQSLFEQDKINFSKNLLKSEKQVVDLNTRIKMILHQYQEEFSSKDTLVMRGEFALQKSEEEKEGVNKELLNNNLELKECKATILEMQQKQESLETIVKKSMNERDILDTQLVCRNSEFPPLYENIKLLQYTLDNGESQNEQRMEDIRLLKLEIENLRYDGKVKELTYQMEDTVGEVKMQEQLINDHKKALAEADTKYCMQQSLYEQERADKNNFSKNLLESEDQIVELKLKIKAMTHQIQELKEDFSSKETLLLRGEFALQTSEKEKEAVQEVLQNTNLELKGCKATILEMQQKQETLEKMIKQADVERERKQNALDQTMNERDIQGTQLVRCNDELSLLYEKTKLLQYKLDNGESQYEQRMEDIRLLNLEIKKLGQEKGLLSKNVSNMADLRQEILHLQSELKREEHKCRALEEDLQTPLNMHRWRELKGTDLEAYELIQKVQILQKRFIAQSSSAQAREQQLRETEQLCENMHQLLMRQPGPDTVNSVQEPPLTLRQKWTKMRKRREERRNQKAGVHFNQTSVQENVRAPMSRGKRSFVAWLQRAFK